MSPTSAWSTPCGRSTSTQPGSASRYLHTLVVHTASSQLGSRSLQPTLVFPARTRDVTDDVRTTHVAAAQLYNTGALTGACEVCGGLSGGKSTSLWRVLSTIIDRRLLCTYCMIYNRQYCWFTALMLIYWIIKSSVFYNFNIGYIGRCQWECNIGPREKLASLGVKAKSWHGEAAEEIMLETKAQRGLDCCDQDNKL